MLFVLDLIFPLQRLGSLVPCHHGNHRSGSVMQKVQCVYRSDNYINIEFANIDISLMLVYI